MDVLGGSAAGSLGGVLSFEEDVESAFFAFGSLRWDFFVWDQVSVTAIVSGAYRTDELSTGSSLGAGSGIGFYLPLSDRLGLWPRANVTLYTRESRGEMEESSSRMYAALEVPLLWEVKKHVLFGLGPEFAVPLVERFVVVSLTYHVAVYF